MLVAGQAKYAVVYRALAQGQFARYGEAPRIPAAPAPLSYFAPYGISTPAQTIALRTTRFMHEHGVTRDALAAVALTSYAHAQRNPRAVMYGRPLTREQYDDARMIAEPFCLYDCCMENDGAAAMILTLADRAPDAPRVLAVAQGSTAGFSLFGTRPRDYASANFRSVAPRLWEQAGVGPDDVDVAGVYENFTGAVVMSLVEHGFCAPDDVMKFCTPENLSFDGGRLPLNTSGGNLAHCYMHGLELVIECVRQLRGTSTAQVPDARVAMVAGGPVTAPVSSLVIAR
jgi:acetyl-CoA acetyltransferase